MVYNMLFSVFLVYNLSVYLIILLFRYVDCFSCYLWCKYRDFREIGENLNSFDMTVVGHNRDNLNQRITR